LVCKSATPLEVAEHILQQAALGVRDLNRVEKLGIREAECRCLSVPPRLLGEATGQRSGLQSSDLWVYCNTHVGCRQRCIPERTLGQRPQRRAAEAVTTDVLAELLVSKSRTPTDRSRDFLSGRNHQEQGRRRHRKSMSR
jgi:hypothetical protein